MTSTKAICPMSGKRANRYPGRDQCEHCGRVVWIRQADNAYTKHTIPDDKYWEEVS